MPLAAAKILAHVDELDLWRGLLLNDGKSIRLQTMIYLTDRRDGKPKQAVEVEGKIAHAPVAYRDPRLAGLIDEELRGLSAVLPKLAVGLPDRPHNQTQSVPEANAVPMLPSALPGQESPELPDESTGNEASAEVSDEQTA